MIYDIKRRSAYLTAHADQASRLRLALQALMADYHQRLKDLLPLRQLLKGSVYELKTRCGKPSCHCASPDGPLHTTTVLSWSERGKTRLRTLPSGEQARLRRLAENYRRFRQARADLVKLHRRILLNLDRLEKNLRLPPPKLAARKRRQE